MVLLPVGTSYSCDNYSELALASMSDTFVKLNAKGLAQWRYASENSRREFVRTARGTQGQGGASESIKSLYTILCCATDLSDKNILESHDYSEKNNHERIVKEHRELINATPQVGWSN